MYQISLFSYYFSITRNYKKHDYMTILSLTGPILSCILFIFLDDNIVLATAGKQIENRCATLADKSFSTPDKDPFFWFVEIPTNFIT